MAPSHRLAFLARGGMRISRDPSAPIRDGCDPSAPIARLCRAGKSENPRTRVRGFQGRKPRRSYLPCQMCIRDSAYTEQTGLARPIAHGVSLGGFTMRHIISSFFPGEPERMKRFKRTCSMTLFLQHLYWLR